MPAEERDKKYPENVNETSQNNQYRLNWFVDIRMHRAAAVVVAYTREQAVNNLNNELRSTPKGM